MRLQYTKQQYTARYINGNYSFKQDIFSRNAF